MTDLEKFIALYRELGVELKVIPFTPRKPDPPDAAFKIMLGSGEETEEFVSWDKWAGYMSFYSDILFNRDGKFLKQGFWE